MKALKSELAKKILADKAAAEELRAAMEFVVSSKSKRTKQQAPVITYRDEHGNQKKVRLEVVSLT
ncbi:hypothetical protein ABRZ04_13660 [Castellaniella ginsengisoli]|uniref:Uncharacterized protein n=1 Tax=Castellaniella ginsengisoli TaxID=546114 RepID=A0AB39FNF0_9BURK